MKPYKKRKYTQINDKVRDRYFNGWKNQLIRIYYYLDEGLSLLNQFKYLVAGIIALAVVLEIEQSIEWMIIMFAVSLPILIVAGYIWTRRVKKTIEWFSVEHTTHFSKHNINLQEDQLELLT